MGKIEVSPYLKRKLDTTTACTLQIHTAFIENGLQDLRIFPGFIFAFAAHCLVFTLPFCKFQYILGLLSLVVDLKILRNCLVFIFPAVRHGRRKRETGDGNQSTTALI